MIYRELDSIHPDGKGEENSHSVLSADNHTIGCIL